MSKKRRADASVVPPAEVPATEFDPVPAAVARPPPPLDPAVLVAVETLRRAAARLLPGAFPIGSPGSVAVVRTPSADWTEVAGEAWAVLAHGGVQGRVEGGGDWIDRSAAWTSFIRPDAASRHTRNGIDTGEELLAKAMWNAKPAAGFSPEPEALLPRDLVQGADFRLEMPFPDPEDVAAAALRLCGRMPGQDVTAAEAAALTPRLLRLARRPGQDADGYIAKIRDLLARERVAPAAAATAPRDAPTLARLHGMDEAVAWGMDLACDLAAHREGRLAWSDVDRGCLLSGPPGCGKTMFARALAATCGVPLVTGSYGEWLGTGSAHQGDLLKAMRGTFSEARAAAPAILFIDEVDSFPDRGRISHRYVEWETQVVNALLAEVDGVNGREGVVLVGACNHPEKRDPALVRSGRLDRHVRIGLPDRAALAAILREHLGDDLAGADLSGAAMAAAGSSGADCERLVRGARRRARSAGRPMLLVDLLDEVGGDVDGPDADGRTAAVHEAGHVVAACVLRPGSVGMVSMRGAGDAGGMTEAALLRSAYLRPEDLRIRLAVLLAGRAAEEAVFGVASSGAGGTRGSDLARATMAVLDAFAAFGLDDAGGGLVWRGVADAGGIPKVLAADPALAERVRARLDDAYGEVLGLLRPRLAAVEALASALLERRVLDGPDAEAIVMAHEPCGGLRP